MSLVAKLAIATLTTLTAGGGTALGLLATSNKPSTPTQETNSNTGASSSSKIEPSSGSQNTLGVTQPSAQQGTQPLEVENLKGEGNCQVQDGWEEKVIQHLSPEQETRYVVAFCKNSGGSDSSLINWRGFFPEKLMVGGVEAFSAGYKFYVEVKEEKAEGAEEEDLFSRTYKATFSSKQFTTPSVNGTWGDEIIFGADTTDGTIYEVKITGSDSVDKFYLQWIP